VPPFSDEDEKVPTETGRRVGLTGPTSGYRRIMRTVHDPGRTSSATTPAHHRDAVASATRHTGPTAERWHQAFEHYLAAVAQHPSATNVTTMSPPALIVADVMTAGVVTAHEDAAFKEILSALARNRIAAVPVIDTERRVVGVVSESDLLAHIVGRSGHSEQQRKHDAVTARELMTSPAVTTTPTTTIVEAARHAARTKVRRMPVVDGAGVLVGIVSRADLLKIFLREDDDIRADIERDVLGYKMAIDRSLVDVSVEEGIVTLSGQVHHKAQIAQAVELSRHVFGVVDVRSELTFPDERAAGPGVRLPV